ncbi:heterokaryon incompatibility protein-domain-containing protein [Paraphoma chrysanthemicola]|uniref:Heterokaryon incompatibility protein-domain-containing protein n=1 Tax=Paraphoma chrysanthemicola TaxID=798071 RepID=A0A8K0VR54_9PLEO|nr:heterokaryon incompatibility protein-domain-containing protein [Paraphoma chrysanthemicola]
MSSEPSSFDSDEHLLCHSCRKIDFHALTQSLLDENSRAFQIDLSSKLSLNCPLCQILGLTQSRQGKQSSAPQPDGSDVHLHAISSRWYYYHQQLVNTKYDFGNVRFCVLLLTEFDKLYRWFDRNWVFCVPRKSFGRGLFGPQIVKSECDFSLANGWLANCVNTHECGHTGSPQPVPGMKVIDCQRLTVVPAEDGIRWVALSYVWGKAVQVKDKQRDTRNRLSSNTTLPDIIPQTVRDAVIVTRKMGYRFLWVDEFCIDQTDEANKATQIRNMDSIYHNAEITIVAAAGTDKHYGLPGVSTTPRTASTVVNLEDFVILSIGRDPTLLLHYSEWMKRGWTYQEGLLSSRLLIFTDEQISFHCCVASWQEGLTGPENLHSSQPINWEEWTIRYKELIRPPRLPMLIGVRHDCLSWYMEYFSHIQEYSRRTLSKESDYANAFTGIITHMEKQKPPRYNFWGLPFIPQTGQENLEVHLFVALSWSFALHHVKSPRLDVERRNMHPSWTWLGWQGPIFWALGEFDDDSAEIFPSFKVNALDVDDRPAHASDDGTHPLRLWSCLTDTGGLSLTVKLIPGNWMVDDSGERLVDMANIKVPKTPLRIEYGSSAITFKTVPNYSIVTGQILGSDTMELLPSRLAGGMWSLCLLGRIDIPHNHTVIVMLIEWLGRDNAQRIDLLKLGCHKDCEGSLDVVESTLEHRNIMLV